MLKWSAMKDGPSADGNGGTMDILVSERHGDVFTDGASVNYNVNLAPVDGHIWAVASVFILTGEGKVAHREFHYIARDVVQAVRIVEALHASVVADSPASIVRGALTSPEATKVGYY